MAMRLEQWGGLRVRVVDTTAGTPGPAVVLMHGFGASGEDLVPLAGEIDAPARFVFPEAPLALPADSLFASDPDGPEGGAGRAWWPIDMVRLQVAMMTGRARDLTREVPEGLAPARQKVLQMLSEMREALGLGAAPIFLGGFSQGAMLACDVALRSEVALAGLLLMSGTLLCEDDWLGLMPKRAGLPALVSHGRQDPLLPFDVAERLRDELGKAGLRVSWVPFHGGHGIAPEVLTAASKLIAAPA